MIVVESENGKRVGELKYLSEDVYAVLFAGLEFLELIRNGRHVELGYVIKIHTEGLYWLVSCHVIYYLQLISVAVNN